MLKGSNPFAPFLRARFVSVSMFSAGFGIALPALAKGLFDAIPFNELWRVLLIIALGLIVGVCVSGVRNSYRDLLSLANMIRRSGIGPFPKEPGHAKARFWLTAVYGALVGIAIFVLTYGLRSSPAPAEANGASFQIIQSTPMLYVYAACAFGLLSAYGLYVSWKSIRK
jgi:hypothetical protein